MKLVDGACLDLVVAADLAEKGTWPLSGGWLDQTQACVEGVRHFWAEQQQYRLARSSPPLAGD